MTKKKPPEDPECEELIWQGDDLAVPLSQLIPTCKITAEARQAAEDWHYWVQMGYLLC